MNELKYRKTLYFSRQPFWEVTRLREDSLLCLEDCELRLLRFSVNHRNAGLNCIPGVGQMGLAFSVRETKASAYVFGVLPEKKEIPLYGIGQALMVQFTPGGFTQATGIPADEVPAEGLKLENVFPWALTIAEDAYMMQRGREIRMKELERCYGYTARSIRRLVLRNVGIPPKQLNLQICLQSAIRQLSQGGKGSLTELSQQLDFYDQSHFNRIFRRMTGFCPGEYLKWQKQKGDAKC